MKTPIRVLIADDHPLYRAGLRALLNSVPETEIVGEAHTGEEAVKQAATFQPDVILMDIKMPVMNGIHATRWIVDAQPHVAVVMLTMFGDEESLAAALRAGARGYVLKDADQSVILGAIESALNGTGWVKPRQSNDL
jgi:DNA-binding NarL/FixJ family response regulator